ncbi:NAD/NADP octopine/nopaline dehydrogenase family protein, partial [uncultured Alistipes sp.]
MKAIDFERIPDDRNEPTKPYTFCICGGGALGHVLAGVIGAQGYDVRMLTGHPDAWQSEITVEDLAGSRCTGRLHTISDRAECTAGAADIVLLCVPGHLIRRELLRIAPCLKPGTRVGSIVSSTGFFIMAKRIFGTDYPLFGFQRVPFIARVGKYGSSAQLLGYKSRLNMAFTDARTAEECIPLFESILRTPVSPLHHILEAMLTNSNPILHPARLYGLFSEWRPGMTYERIIPFYEAWDDRSSEVLIRCDEEFQRLLRRLPVREGTVPPLLEYYESTDAASLTRKIRSIEAFRGIGAPMKCDGDGFVPDFEHRYFTEDIPYGMLLLKYMAQLKGVETPAIDTV